MRAHPIVLAGVLLSAPGALAQHAPRQGASLLRFQYAAGQRARYVTRTTQTMPGGEAPTVSTSTHEVETVRVNPDGSAEQRLRILRVDVSGAQAPEALRARVASALTGVTWAFTQDARGRVVARRAAGEVPDEVRPVLDGVLDSLDQMGAALPAEPVAPGATWRERRTLHVVPGAGGLDMNVDATYTLRQVRGAGPARAAVLGVAMTLSTPPGANLRGVRVNGSGSAAGEAVVELGRGRLGRGHTAGSMRIQMTVGGRAIDLQSRFEHDMAPEAAGAARR